MSARTSGVQEFRRFFRHLVPILLLAVGWIVLWFIIFNVIDPYGVTGWPTVSGVNDVKPLQSRAARIYKPLAFLRGDFNGIVLGASRELRGIDPQNLRLREAGYRFYNFGLSEERLYESEEILEFASRRPTIKTILLDIDFTRYNVDPLSIGDLRTYYPKGPILPWAIKQYVQAAVSLQGIDDSYATVLASRRGQAVLRHTPDGREEMPGRRPQIGYDYNTQFANVFEAYLNTFLPKISAEAKTWMICGFDHSMLSKTIEFAIAHKMRLVAFIAPDHALEMEALRRKELWPVFEAWKRGLVKIFSTAAAAHPDANIVLWDFSGYNSVTTEPFPTSGAQEMDYWDPVHYTISMGDRILATTLQLDGYGNTASDFGLKLTPSNIDRHLADIRADQAGYETSHPDDLKWLANLDKATPSATDAAAPPHCSD